MVGNTNHKTPSSCEELLKDRCDAGIWMEDMIKGAGPGDRYLQDFHNTEQ